MQVVSDARRRKEIEAVLSAIALSAQRKPRPCHRNAERIRKSHANWWMQRNVIGMCIARKLSGGTLDRTLALQVLVRKKRAQKQLRQNAVPRFVRARWLDISSPVVTDVLEVGDLHPASPLGTAERPARPGYNIGHESSGCGTLGCVVVDREAGTLAALSCAHVIAQNGSATPGDVVFVPSYDLAEETHVLQEAPFGTLLRTGKLRAGRNFATSNLDAALVVPYHDADLSRVVAIEGVAPTGIRTDIHDQLAVSKVGAATGRTFGKIEGTSAVISLPYVINGTSRTVWHSDLIAVSKFTDDGDSGALVMDEEHRAVGIHIASGAQRSFALPIQRALDGLGCDLLL